MPDDAIRIEPALYSSPQVQPASGAGGQPASPGAEGRPDPIIRIAPPRIYTDPSTLFALAIALSLITMAIFLEGSKASFFDIPSALLVILGTAATTCISYTSREIRLAIPVMTGSFQRTVFDAPTVARELLDLAVIARKRGMLQLFNYAEELEKNKFLHNAVQMVTDGMSMSEIDRLINQDIDITMEGYRKAAGMMRKASEIAPAMGLIGTLIGLVQMLVALDNPAAIGPAMALGLLTTFYGAVLGSVVLGPLAAKLDRNAQEDVLIKLLIQAAALSIVAQENPRKLEMELNSLLPPDQRVTYFKF